MKGRIVVFKGVKQPFEIQEYDVPDPAPGAIVCKTTYAGICGSDLHSWRGEGNPAPPPPQGRTRGHEGAGVVYKLGEGVTTDYVGNPLQEGDRVIWTGLWGCRRCEYCLTGHQNWCSGRTTGGGPAGEYPYFTSTMGDYYYVRPDQEIFKVPDGVPDSALGFINCATGTVVEGMRQAGVESGDYLVIQGAGGLGLNAIAFAKDMGVNRVIVLDRLQGRLDMAREFGADHVINVQEVSTPEERKALVWELTNGHGADVVLEVAGRAELLPEGVSYLANDGTFVEIGAIVAGYKVEIDPTWFFPARKIMGTVMYPPSLIPVMLEALDKMKGKVPFDRIVSHTFPFDKVNEAFESAEWWDRQTEVTRVMLTP